MPPKPSEIPKIPTQKRSAVSKKLSLQLIALLVTFPALLSASMPTARAADALKAFSESGYKAYCRGDWSLASKYFWYVARDILRRPAEKYRYPCCLVYLGKSSFKEGKNADAETYLRQALTICKRDWGSDHFLVAQILRELSPVLRQRGKVREADIYDAQANTIFPKPAKPISDKEVHKVSGPGIDPFYARGISANGIQIMSSAAVSPEALIKAAEIIDVMLSGRPDIRNRLIPEKANVAIMSISELTTDIPEFRHKKGLPTPDGRDRDRDTRGQGGTVSNPATSAAEENLMLVPSDLYLGTCVLVHEFAHTILSLGLSEDERNKVGFAFENAKKLGLWANTYAQMNMDEYFAEAATSYFNANQRPNFGVHNGVRTRAQLKSYDPEIYKVLERIFPLR